MIDRSQQSPMTEGPAKHSPFASVRAWLVLLALVSLLPLAATMLYTVNETRLMAHQQAQERLGLVVRVIGVEIAQASAAARQLVLALAQSPGTFLETTERCSRLLSMIGQQYPIYASMFSTDERGNVLCSSVPLGEPVSLSDRAYFARAMISTEPVIGDVIIGRISGRHTLTFAVAMRDGNGNAQGVLGASIDLRRFLEELDRSHGELLPGTVLTIWNHLGEVVARVPDREGIAGRQSGDSALFQAMAAHGLRLGYQQLEGLDGVERHYAFTGFGPNESRIWVSAGISSAQMLEDVRRVFVGSIVAIVIVGLVSLILAWAIGGRSILRPVRRLTAVTRSLARGETGVRVGRLSGANEIVELGEGFRHMISALDAHESEQRQAQARLKEARDSLESTVRERTAELTNASIEASEKAGRLERLRREDQVLNEMTGLLQSCRNLDEAYPVLERGLGALFIDRPGQLCLLRESGNALVAAATWGQTAPDASTVFAPEDCWSLRLGHAYSFQRDGQRPQCGHVHGQAADYACVPLLGQGKTIGVLHVLGGDESTGRPLLQTTADRIALALANIKLRESLLNLSIRDPLTGLYNRRYVEETLEREAQRCLRGGRSMSVLMLDVDHFKRFNDTFGHDAGDVVLRTLGALLKQQFRSSDLPCRLGGEEFLVILPESDEASAFKRAEGVREAVAALDLHHDGKSLGAVTASIGVATFPKPVEHHEHLIQTADMALYRAKQEGRNRVCIATKDGKGS